MPRTGPRRTTEQVRLSDDERAPVDALAATLPPGPGGHPNFSEAARQLLAAGAATLVGPTGDALTRLAARGGLDRSEIVHLALSYAVQHATDWAPTQPGG